MYIPKLETKISSLYRSICSTGKGFTVYGLQFTVYGGSTLISLIKENPENPFLLLMCFTHWYSVRESSNPSKPCLRCFTNRIQPYGLSNRTEKQRKKFTVYRLPFTVYCLLWFPLTSYIIHLTSYLLHLTSEKRWFFSHNAQLF